MEKIDWIVIFIYLAGLIVLGWHLGRRQKDLNDYFLGSKNLPWWAVGFSTMATQLGAISFISAPAFVGLRQGGGLIWLGYEFAVPFAMILLIWKVIPLFHKSGVISIYEYLEQRFDRKSRIFVSLIFLISRALATGVAIYAAAIVIAVVLKIPLTFTILIIGVVAIVYDYMGGIKAVVYSDVIQMGVIIIGLVVCAVYGIHEAGGWNSAVKHFHQERLTSIIFSQYGFSKGGDFGFFPLLLGGFFLYTSYYGFDQSQVQRELSARSLKDSRKSLIFNAFARYPIVLFYCILGLVIGSFALNNPEFMGMIPKDKIDYMIPVFVVHYLPAGFSGFIIIAILAASMSSLDSALNSLSASTIEDILKPGILKNTEEHNHLAASKIVTLFWGIFCTGFAFFVGRISGTVIESINMIGSIFYGPIAAVFILGIFVDRSSSRDIVAGGLAGVLLNLVIAFFFKNVSWLWWNVIGFETCFISGYLLSLLNREAPLKKEIVILKEKFSPAWILIFLMLIIYGIAIIIFSNNLRYILS